MRRWPALAICLMLTAGLSFSQSSPKTLTGILRQLTDDNVVIQTGEKSTLIVALGITTKYYRGTPEGAMIIAHDFHPGDHVSIDATEDDRGVYHALNLSLVKPGTPAERAAATRPLDGDAAEAGPPELRRGVPRHSPSSTDIPLVAANESRPGLHAADVNGVTRTPPPPEADSSAPAADTDSDTPRYILPKTGDPVIDKARQAAFAYAQTLPNFVVKEYTTRYASETLRGSQTSWHTLDVVTADLVSEGGQESYKNILVNGRKPAVDIAKTGTWSTGAYASILFDVLAPDTNALFRGKRSTTIKGRDAWLYDFSVEKRNSHWEVTTEGGTYVPPYTGSIWIDKESARALRIELSAHGLPDTFLLDTVENAVDYDFVPIGEGKYLLPVHSEALSCERHTSYCSRNVIDFRNYKKFSADTSITFDSDSNK